MDQRKFFPLLLVAVTLTVASAVFLRSTSAPEISYDASSVGAEDLAEAVQACQEKSSGSLSACMQTFFATALGAMSITDLAGVFEKALGRSAPLRLECHQVVHAFGRAAFATRGNISEAFREGTTLRLCAGGYFHGVIEAFFRSDADGTAREDDHIALAEIEERIPTMCDRFEEIDRRSQCIHGVGHGVLYLLGYNIEETIRLCELYDVRDRFSCFTGIFMENALAFDSPLRVIDDEDPHFPCNTYKGSVYKNPCYYVQPFRMHEMALTDEDIVRECQSVEGFARTLCLRGLGIFYLSHEALAVGPEGTVEFCGALVERDARICAESVASRMVSHTEDGQYAFPFCALFMQKALEENCFEYAAEVLYTGFGMEEKAIVKECREHVPDNETCIDAVDAVER